MTGGVFRVTSAPPDLDPFLDGEPLSVRDGKAQPRPLIEAVTPQFNQPARLETKRRQILESGPRRATPCAAAGRRCAAVGRLTPAAVVVVSR